jgi:hypothetical protein
MLSEEDRRRGAELLVGPPAKFCSGIGASPMAGRRLKSFPAEVAEVA